MKIEIDIPERIYTAIKNGTYCGILDADVYYAIQSGTPISKNYVSRQDVIDSLYDWADHSATDFEMWHLRQIAGDIKSMNL